MNQLAESIYLAWRDWKFEWLLSLCAVFALASMLTPILVLQGLKNGVIEGMREQLMQDPTVLIIRPKGEANFSPEFIQELQRMPGAKFAIGRTRATSTDLTLTNPKANVKASIALEPASPGEPVLDRYHVSAPKNSAEPEIILSQPAAKALNVQKGSILNATLGRRTPTGRLESVPLIFHVVDVMPIKAGDRRMGFVAARLLEDMENYHDYLEVPDRGYSGNPAEGRHYASFRLYAQDLDQVEVLAANLEKQHVEVITKAREIAGIRMLESAINQVILIITAAVGLGFLAFTLSSVQSAISRKKRMLGMLRLLGFNQLPLMLYPLTQILLTAVAGFILALFVYWLVSLGIAQAFADQGALKCSLSFANIGVSALAVIVLSLLACVGGAYQAAKVEPSMVIREV